MSVCERILDVHKKISCERTLCMMVDERVQGIKGVSGEYMDMIPHGSGE